MFEDVFLSHSGMSSLQGARRNRSRPTPLNNLPPGFASMSGACQAGRFFSSLIAAKKRQESGQLFFGAYREHLFNSAFAQG